MPAHDFQHPPPPLPGMRSFRSSPRRASWAGACFVVVAALVLLACRPRPEPTVLPTAEISSPQRLVVDSLPSATPTPFPSVERIDEGIPAYATVSDLLVDTEGWWAATYDRVGLYLSTDDGRNWRPAPGFSAQPVYALASAGGDRFAATPNGLWVHRDRGWQRVEGLPEAEVMALAADGEILYAATDRAGLRRLEDGRIVSIPVPEKGSAAGLLSVAASEEWLIIGTSGAGGWQSHDGGTTWDRLPSSASAFISAVAIADRRQATVRTLDGLWQTGDGGLTWRALSSAPSGVALLAESDALTVGTSRGEVVQSTDGGRSWETLGTGLNRRLPVITLARDERGRLLAGMQDGLWSLDGGRWQRRTGALGRVRVEALARLADGTLLAGHRDGVYRSADRGATWASIAAPFAGRAVIALAPDPAGPTAVYAGTDGAGIFRSEDGGQSWRHLRSESALDSQIIPALFPDPLARGHLLARVAYERVYESKNGGRSWTPRWEGLSTVTEMFTVAYDPHLPGRVFAGAADGLLRRDPGQVEWRRTAPELEGQTVLALLPDPQTEDRLWIGTTRGLFVSDDGGDHASPTVLQGATVSVLAFDGETLFVGTKFRGLFALRGDHAAPLSPLAERTVTALLATEDSLLIATDDGLWRVRDLPGHLFRSEVRAESVGPFETYRSPATSNAARDRAAARAGPVPAVHLLNPSDRLFRLAAENGFRAVVVVFPWREIEPNPDEFHWEHTDLWVAVAKYYGLDLVVRLDQSPRWTAPHSPEETLNPVPERPEDFRHFAFEVARRYAGDVRGYILWNEPNLAIEWGGRRPSPGEYTALLRAGAAAIREADPDALIVAGGLATTTRDDDVAVDDLRFLEGMYAAGAAPWFDVLAAHPYGFGLAPDAPATANDGMNVRRLASLRAVMAHHGDGKKPIWVTEFGWSTAPTTLGGQVTPATQAEYLLRGRELITGEFPGVELITVWNLAEGLAANDEKAGYNLLGPDGAPTEALTTLAAANGGPVPTPSSATPDPIALSPDTQVHLGDSEMPPPWWPLYRARNPSITWHGGFYLRSRPTTPMVLSLELMQPNEYGNSVWVNGQRLNVDPLPVEDFTSQWVTLSFPVVCAERAAGGIPLLQAGYNEVEFRISHLLPAFQQKRYVWDDVLIRNVRLHPADTLLSPTC